MEPKEADLLRDAVLIADHERGHTVIADRNAIIKALVDRLRLSEHALSACRPYVVDTGEHGILHAVDAAIKGLEVLRAR